MNVGDVLADRYELLDEIGVGGMGRVLRARDRTLGRDVAVKLLAPHLLGDQGAVAALRDEARRAAAVRHPNVVQVLDAVLDDTDQPAIVMEHVDGPSLQELVPPDGMPVDEALAVLGAVGAGLAAVHAAGLVHRDVTPSNVLIDDGVPRLTDFGIARSAAATATQTVRGSVGYLAPEQASGARVGPAADVYALGCLATTLLTGRPPFDADTAVGVVHQHLHDAPPDLRARRADVPEGVAAAVAQALAKAPEERPGSVTELLGRLGLGAAAPVAAPAAPAGADAVTTVVPARSTTQQLEDPGPVTATRAWRPSRTALAALAALVVVGAAVAGAIGLLGGEQVPAVTASPSTVPRPSPTPAPRSSPSPSTSPSPPASPTTTALDRLQELRALLLDLQGRGELEPEAMEKLDERAAEAVEKTRDGKPEEASRKLEDLRRDLDERVRKDEASSSAREELLVVVQQAQDALAAVPSENEGDDGDDEGEGAGDRDEGNGRDDDDD